MLVASALSGFGRKSFRPASFVFNGTDEVLSRTVSSSLSTPTNTIFTTSMWLKATNTPADAVADVLLNYDAGSGVRTRLNYETTGTNTGLSYVNSDEASSSFVSAQLATTTDIGNGQWYHLVWRIDNTHGTADDRVRMYVDNTLQDDTEFNATELNQVTHFFQNSTTAFIGALSASGNFFDGRMAFIEVLQDISAAPSEFAFTNGSTWTRKPYQGSYGTYGFRLDGTALFQDTSGNDQHFTGTNMDASNLDYSDLPPYVY